MIKYNDEEMQESIDNDNKDSDRVSPQPDRLSTQPPEGYNAPETDTDL